VCHGRNCIMISGQASVVISHKVWCGSLRNPKEVMGNKTIGVCMLVLRAIWETGGTAALEHPLSSGIWRLQCIHSFLGLHGVRKVRLHQCMYGLRPSDDCSARYRKATGLILVGGSPFRARTCDGSRRHVPILGTVTRCGPNDVQASVARSHESGVYPASLCRCLAKFHCYGCCRRR